MLKWLSDQGCPWDEWDCASVARKEGRWLNSFKDKVEFESWPLELPKSAYGL